MMNQNKAESTKSFPFWISNSYVAFLSNLDLQLQGFLVDKRKRQIFWKIFWKYFNKFEIIFVKGNVK